MSYSRALADRWPWLADETINALTQALLAVEWAGEVYVNDAKGSRPGCPECCEPATGGAHAAGCVVEVGLVVAGLHDQATRTDARRLLAESAKREPDVAHWLDNAYRARRGEPPR